MPPLISVTKKVTFALASLSLGLWTFKKVNEVSGPAFEPILKACTDSSLTSDMEKFAKETGYHAFEPMVGLGLFNVLVCLITQFLFELRNTYPEGVIVWSGVILVSITCTVAITVESGRKDSRGFLRYPIPIGLLAQLFGISVIVPLLWVPAYIYGAGSLPVSPKRTYASIPLSLPAVILTVVVFVAETDGRLWTVAAGILGGPILALSSVCVWPITAPTSHDLANDCARAVRQTYLTVAFVSYLGYAGLVSIVYRAYGTDVLALWDAVWTNANPSVAFMTVDTLVLYVSLLSFVAYRDLGAAAKAVILTPLLGPAATSYVLADVEIAETGQIVSNKMKKE